MSPSSKGNTSGKKRTGSPSTRRSKPRGRNPTIGYLALRTSDNVGQALWTGVVDAAQEHGANLICFVGDRLRDPTGASSPANVLYDLVSPGVVDGLVSWASSMGGSLEHDEIVRFHRRYHPLPIVSITLPMAGCPTVQIDSYQGMRDVLAHLIEFHGYRRLAFIHGLEGHYYAQERYRAYTDALQTYGIPLDPNLITLPGDFIASTGEEGIHLLLDERKLRPGVDFDAVVTTSDLPALGVLDALQARGVRVPEEVALAGFNDSLEGRFVLPPLTSVKLPFYEQGKKAVEMLLAILAGEQVPEQVVLSASLRVRQSCGCLLPSVARAAAGSPPEAWLQPAAGETFETTCAARREAIAAEMIRAAETSAESLHPEWAERLLDIFIADVIGTSETENSFLRELDHLLRQVMSAGGQVGDWQNVVSALRRHALPCFGSTDATALRRAEDLWGQAWVLTGEAAQRVRGHKMVQSANQAQILRQINRALGSTFDVAELADVLARDLNKIGIERCYLSLYQDPQNPTERSQLILACDNQGRIELAEKARVFPSNQLAPNRLLVRHRPDKPYCLVAEPLYFREEQIGFVLFGVGPRDGTIYAVLREQISSSLKGALLFDEARKARAAAEKADHLKTRLLANVSHELRTPLNVITGCTLEALNMPTPYGTTLPEALLKDLQHIHHSAEHQLRVINDLLDLSRAEIDELDLYPELLDPRALLEEVFCSMADAHPSSDVTWHLQLSDRLPTIWADPVRLRQILLNLLSNASKFTEKGQIVLAAEVTPPHLHIWVQDTGSGIPLDVQESIFEPFITVGHANRQMEGVGLGLSITRRLVALHRGSMRLESQPGQGSTFHVYLPLPTLSDQPITSPAATQPTLLLISAQDQIAAEIAAFSQRQGLEVLQLKASDDLNAVVQRALPAALAWDLTDASPSEWIIVRRLRNHPRLSQVPFILYGQETGQDAAPGTGLTSFVVKPTNRKTLLETIEGFRPSTGIGPILIVDDDSQIRDLYREVVANGFPGYPVHTAADGAAALDFMAKETPSLVILDLMMPEMDGFDVLDQIRADNQTRRVPVLVLSSRLLNFEDVKRLERHAQVVFQSKGVLSEEELVASLHRALFGTDTLPQHTGGLVKRAVAYFHQNYNRPLSRWEMAEAIGVSEDYLSRIFRQEMGISPWEYLNRYRILRAKDLLHRTGDNVRIVAQRVGFTDPAYFSRVFRKVTGTSPSAYREDQG